MFCSQFEAAADAEAAAEHKQWELSYQTAMDQPPLPPAEVDDGDDDDGDDPRPDEAAEAAAIAAAPPELGVEREALAFVAGYVAFKCKHIRDDLGQPTSSAPDSPSVPSRWLRAISRGSLYVPSDWWMAFVVKFNDSFSALMGPTANKAPNILRRLVELILAQMPDLDRRIARKLASTRLHYRLRWLNVARAEAQAKRYQDRKILQHSKSSKY